MMTHTPGSDRQPGFTLIEVLLALGITAIVMLTVVSTFRITLEAREMIEEIGESTEAGPRILHLIERDLRGLWTMNVSKNAILVGRNMDVGSFEADRIDFLTTTDAAGFVLDNQSRQVRPSICEVGYWLKPHPRYRDLIELWRREDPMVDDSLLEGGTFQLVHDRIKSFKITYYKSLGYEAEEFHMWDTAEEDALPRRIKIEFTLERKRGSRNLVSDVEIEDFEGAEKTYTRHIVFDHRYMDILKAGTAMVPLTPPPPEAGGGGPAGPGGPAGEGGRGAGPGGPGSTEMIRGMGDGRGQGSEGGRVPDGRGFTEGGGRPPGGPTMAPPRGSPPAGTPFNLGELLRGGGSGGGLGGLFGGGGR